MENHSREYREEKLREVRGVLKTVKQAEEIIEEATIWLGFYRRLLKEDREIAHMIYGRSYLSQLEDHVNSADKVLGMKDQMKELETQLVRSLKWGK